MAPQGATTSAAVPSTPHCLIALTVSPNSRGRPIVPGLYK